jgi:hypothetical protein
LAINRLDLAFWVEDASPSDVTFTARLWQGAARDRLVLESSFSRSQIQNKQPLTCYFAPEKSALGQTYVWEVSTEAPQTGVRLCAGPDGKASPGVYGLHWASVYEGELYIAERTTPLPRAFVVYATETIADEAQAITRLLDEAFAVRHTAITSVPVALPATTPPPGSSQADIVTYENERVVIRANTPQTGLLVLGDSFHPGWTVRIDQQPAQMLRANLVWRGVILPAGQHVVEFIYFPRSLQIGLALGAVSLAALVALSLLGRRGIQPRSAEAQTAERQAK